MQLHDPWHNPSFHIQVAHPDSFIHNHHSRRYIPIFSRCYSSNNLNRLNIVRSYTSEIRARVARRNRRQSKASIHIGISGNRHPIYDYSSTERGIVIRSQSPHFELSRARKGRIFHRHASRKQLKDILKACCLQMIKSLSPDDRCRGFTTLSSLRNDHNLPHRKRLLFHEYPDVILSIQTNLALNILVAKHRDFIGNWKSWNISNLHLAILSRYSPQSRLD